MSRAPLVCVFAAAIGAAACGESSLSAPSTAKPSSTPTAKAAAYAGQWNGSWSNTTSSTSGSVFFVITPDVAHGTVSVAVTIGGPALGGNPPEDPVTFNGMLDAQGMHFTGGMLPALGDCTGALLTDGSVTAHCVNPPSVSVASFDVTGTWPPGGPASLSYSVTFKNGQPPASGTMTAHKS